MAERKRHHRGRRRKKKGGFISNLILIIALIVFCVSGYKLFEIGKGYLDGRSEYEGVIDLVVSYDEEEPQTEEEKEKERSSFMVDFDKLMEINSDTIGWIRFYPEPKIINYPVVQGTDNDRYLHKTFSASDNTLGAIFVDVNCSKDFSDKNTIIYGHRMKDGSMFRKLIDYEEKSFWEENPYFYIYTPDGKEITYKIYSAGVVKSTSNNYKLSFGSDEEFMSFVDYTKSTSNYDTGVEVKEDSQIVTLSTCTAASDSHRFVVHGVKVKEAYPGE